MAKNANLNLTITVNGKEVKNTFTNLRKEYAKAKAQMNRAPIGSNDWKKAAKQVNGLGEALNNARKEQNEFIKTGSKSSEVINEQTASMSDFIASVKSGDLVGIKAGLGGIKTMIVGLTKSAMAFVATPLGATLAVLAGIGLVAKKWFDYNVEIAKTIKLTEQLTGFSGQQLQDYRAQVAATASTFDKDFNEVLRTANALAKQMKISQGEALELINQGFARGADASGDFLDKVREYPIQFKNAGFSAQDFIDIATQEVKGGIYNDKLLDTLKEADLALKEMTATQQEALRNAFGAKFTTELANGIKSGEVSTKQAINRIINQADELGLNLQQKQQLISDVFKGAGEDAGGFSEIVLQLNEAFTSQNKELSENELATLRLVDANTEYEQTLADLFDASKSGFPSMLTNIKAIGIEIFTNTLKGIKLMFTSIEQLKATSGLEGQANAVKDISENMKLFGTTAKEEVEQQLNASVKNIERIKSKLSNLSFTDKLLGSDTAYKQQLAKYEAYHNELLKISEDKSEKFKAAQEKYTEVVPETSIKNTNSDKNTEEDEVKLTPEDKRIIASKKKLAEFLDQWKEDRKIQEQIENLEEDEANQLEEELLLEAKFAKLEADANGEKELLKNLAEIKKQELQDIEDKYNDIKTQKDKKDKDAKIKRDEDFYKKQIADRKKLKNDILNGAIALAGQETKIGQALIAAKGILAAKEMLMQLGVLKGKASVAVAEGTLATSVGAANTAKVGFPQNIPLLIGFAAQAVSIISAIKSATSTASKAKTTGYKDGGFTQSLGYKDHTGEDVAGVVHADEYVVPKYVMNSTDPYVPQVIQYLEHKRKEKLGYFNSGGHTSAPTPTFTEENETSSSQETSTHNLELLSAINRLNYNLESGISAYVVRDYQSWLTQKEIDEEHQRIFNNTRG